MDTILPGRGDKTPLKHATRVSVSIIEDNSVI
jgi:hypothetical protein